MYPRLFVVTKNDNSQVRVLLLKFKDMDEYAFVNITKGHICNCRFNSISAAIVDMQTRVCNGLIKGYDEIPAKEVIF